jgi:hypothetical protein
MKSKNINRPKSRKMNLNGKKMRRTVPESFAIRPPESMQVL